MAKGKPRRVNKTQAQTTTPVVGQVVPPHGRGRLNTGGTPGNKGGPGRPPDILRKRAMLASWKALGEMNARMDDKAQRKGIAFNELTQAAALAAKYLPPDPPNLNVGVTVQILNGPNLDKEKAP